MPRHSTKTSFQKGDPRLAADSPGREAQRATIARLVADGRWVSQRPEVRAKMSGPCPAKGNRYNCLPVGTKRLYANGRYLQVKIAQPNVWAYEHRVVAEARIGRPLVRGEHVHHLNCDPFDNRPENLVVMKHADHARIPRYLNGYARCPICGYGHPPHP